MKETYKPLALLTACVLQAVVMTSCVGSDRLIDAHPSPDGEYRAELSQGDTGAVGDWMSALSVSELHPSFISRLLRSDSKMVFGGDIRSTQVAFQWKTNTQLEIKCTDCDPAKITVKETGWKKVSILYDFQ